MEKKNQEKSKSIQDIWDTIQWSNIYTMGIEEEGWAEKSLEKIMVPTFPNLMQGMNTKKLRGYQEG